jgi:hypothetical protein
MPRSIARLLAAVADLNTASDDASFAEVLDLARRAGAQFATFVSPVQWPHGLPPSVTAEEIARPDGWEHTEVDGDDDLNEATSPAFKVLAYAAEDHHEQIDGIEGISRSSGSVESVNVGVLASGSLVRIRSYYGYDDLVSVSQVSLDPITAATQIPPLKCWGDDGLLTTPGIQSTAERMAMLRDALARGLSLAPPVKSIATAGDNVERANVSTYAPPAPFVTSSPRPMQR